MLNDVVLWFCLSQLSFGCHGEGASTHGQNSSAGDLSKRVLGGDKNRAQALHGDDYGGHWLPGQHPGDRSV